MKIQLSDHFDLKKLLRFTLPSVIMMVFTSVYGVVDGLFVSNFVGETPFKAVNFIWPVIMILGAIGFMFGAGGSALVAKTMGEGDGEKAKRLFSLIVYVTIACGVAIAVPAFIFLPDIAPLLGGNRAEEALLNDAVLYGRIILLALPFYMLQGEFQSFFITAERPGLGLASTVVSGCMNMALDALLTAAIPLGLVGAAAATAISQVVGGIIPVFYFFFTKKSILRLGKTNFDGRALLQTVVNGSSELMSNIAMSVVSILYNAQLLKYAQGDDGIAAYGVLMYVNFAFVAVFIGYSVGIAPVIGYHRGAGNSKELKGLLKKSLLLIGILSLVMFGLAELLGYPIAKIFVGYNDELVKMTVRAFIISSFSFLFSGFAIFGSSFFTALNNGVISAVISFLRTLIFQVAAVLLLPLMWKPALDGIWASIVVAEVMAVVISVIFLLACKKKYRY